MAANPYTTNLELQLDSRDITGLSDGDSVTTWTDSSAAGNDLSQATAANKPAYKTNIIGSNPVVRFAGSNAKSLHCTLASSWSTYTGVTTIFLIQYNELSNNYGGIINSSSSAGSDYINGFSIHCATNGGVRDWGQNVFGLYANNTLMSATVGSMNYGVPTLAGAAVKQGSNGVKIIGPLGTSSEVASTQISGTQDVLVLGNRYFSGSVQTSLGCEMDVAMMLVYKEYMSDSNIGDVVDWILTEFDLHTQAAGGSSSILRMPGMTGGMNG